MPVPKQRHTKSRRNKRRSHHALKKISLSKCSKCAQPVLPHQVCFNCGTYQGREVIDVLAKLSKKEKKQRAKEMAAKEKEQTTQKKELSMEELSKR